MKKLRQVVVFVLVMVVVFSLALPSALAVEEISEADWEDAELVLEEPAPPELEEALLEEIIEQDAVPAEEALFTTQASGNLDFSQGSIFIYENGYSRSEVDTPENKGATYMAYTGTYHITSSANATGNAIVVVSGSHNILVDGVSIVHSDVMGANGFVVQTTGDVTLTFKNGTQNEFVATNTRAGIEKHGDVGKLILRCEGAGGGHTCDDSCAAISVKGGRGAAGVGGRYQAATVGNIEIAGGRWDIVAGSGGAGIGGGMGSAAHNLVVSGGNIKIDGGYSGAAIGGGEGGAGYDIDISGGTIYSSRGDLQNGSGVESGSHRYYGGAGIGGGRNGAGYNITLSGGFVYMRGAGGGASIGGGQCGDGYNITLSAGETSLTANSLSASLGGGSGSANDNAGNGRDIRITGGTHAFATPIGGGKIPHGSTGKAGETGKVTVTGGSVRESAPESRGFDLVNDAGQTLYPTKVTLAKLDTPNWENKGLGKGPKVASLLLKNKNGTVYKYGARDIRTIDTRNVLHLYLPLGTRLYSVTMEESGLWIPNRSYDQSPYHQTTAERNFFGMKKLEGPFVPVTGITGVPTKAVTGERVYLTGTFDKMKILPESATWGDHIYRIKWKIKSKGSTGAVFADSDQRSVTFKYAGTAVVTATIEAAGKNFSNFTKDYKITVTGKPAKPTSFKATGVAGGKVKLTWKKSAGASGYYVYRATSKTGKYSMIKTIPKGATQSFTNTGLKKGKTYYYKLVPYGMQNGTKVKGPAAGPMAGKAR